MPQIPAPPIPHQVTDDLRGPDPSEVVNRQLNQCRTAVSLDSLGRDADAQQGFVLVLDLCAPVSAIVFISRRLSAYSSLSSRDTPSTSKEIILSRVATLL